MSFGQTMQFVRGRIWKDWVQMRKTVFDMRIVRAVRKIVCYNTVAIVLFCGNLCYSEKQRKQERI